MGINNHSDCHKELFNSLMKMSSNPVFITDGKSLYDYNQGFSNLFDEEQIQALMATKRKLTDIFVTDIENFEQNWLEQNSKEKYVTIIDNIINIEHTFILKSEPIANQNLYIVYLQNISNKLEYETSLLQLLYNDRNTNLPNRTKLIEELQSGKLNETSVCLIDINSFKEINDFYGHRTGDYILDEIGKIISKEINHDKELSVYKFPADIYCIVNCGFEKEYFEATVKRILDTIDKSVFFHDLHEINSRVTAGISFSNKNNKLITADLALQSAKKDHKDYVIFYEELDNLQEYENNMKWTKKVKNALKEDNIIVVYQPLINNDKSVQKNMSAWFV